MQEASGWSTTPNAARTISCKACNSPAEYQSWVARSCKQREMAFVHSFSKTSTPAIQCWYHIHNPSIVWNHPTCATVLSYSWWKSCNVYIRPLIIFARPLVILWQNFMARSVHGSTYEHDLYICVGKIQQNINICKIGRTKRKIFFTDFHNAQPLNLTIHCRTMPEILHIKSQTITMISFLFKKGCPEW